MIPTPITEYRQHHLETNMWKHYSGVLHISFTVSVFVSIILYSLFQLENVSWAALWTVPVMFFIGNMIEYMVHRYPLHRPMGILTLLYQIHSLQHHRYYTDEAMEFETTKDFNMVLFPPHVIIFFALIVAPAGWFALNSLIGANVAWLFTFSASSYFLMYEVFHFCHHCADESFVARIPIISRARKIHRAHHNLKLMSKYNFGITLPFGDWIFGTELRDRPHQ